MLNIWLSFEGFTRTCKCLTKIDVANWRRCQFDAERYWCSSNRVRLSGRCLNTPLADCWVLFFIQRYRVVDSDQNYLQMLRKWGCHLVFMDPDGLNFFHLTGCHSSTQVDRSLYDVPDSNLHQSLFQWNKVPSDSKTSLTGSASNQLYSCRTYLAHRFPQTMSANNSASQRGGTSWSAVMMHFLQNGSWFGFFRHFNCCQLITTKYWLNVQLTAWSPSQFFSRLFRQHSISRRNWPQV